MYCSRFLCTLSTDICLKRQEKAVKQSESANTFCESLIFCNNCPQGKSVGKTTKRITDLDVIKIKRQTIKALLAKKDFRMFKIKRIELKRIEKIRKVQLRRRV